MRALPRHTHCPHLPQQNPLSYTRALLPPVPLVLNNLDRTKLSSGQQNARAITAMAESNWEQKNVAMTENALVWTIYNVKFKKVFFKCVRVIKCFDWLRKMHLYPSSDAYLTWILFSAECLHPPSVRFVRYTVLCGWHLSPPLQASSPVLEEKTVATACSPLSWLFFFFFISRVNFCGWMNGILLFSC